MNRKIRKRYLLIMLFPLALLLNYLATTNTKFTEKYFSGGLYKGISWVVGNINGLVPFSVGELLLLIFILTVLLSLVLLLKKLLTRKTDRWLLIRDYILNILLGISILYFAFIIMWGLNYNRLSLSNIMDLEIKPSPTEELVALNEELLVTVNELRGSMVENEEGVMVPFGGAKSGFQRSKLGYIKAATIYPEFAGINSKPKPLLFSSIIAYTNIWGIYSPFTAESNVNMAIPSPMLLSTMMHEMAHQLGFAREDEANYVAYITCSMHPDDDFRYAGALFALSYTMNAVYQQDKEAYRDFYSRLDEGAKRDLAENTKYSKKYEGPVGDAFTKSNDIYLKANNQKDGERSYGRMVDLLLAEYRYKLSR